MSELTDIKTQIGVLIRSLAQQIAVVAAQLEDVKDQHTTSVVDLERKITTLSDALSQLASEIVKLDDYAVEPPVVVPPPVVVTPPVVTPPVVTPPVVTPPPIVIPPPLPATPVKPPVADWRPDLTGLRCASQVPLDRLPAFRQLTEADCDWIIRSNTTGSTAVSTKGLPPVPFDRGSVAGNCYRASRQSGHTGKIVFGVYDNMGMAVVGGKWGATDAHSICKPGETDVNVGFVGLSDVAEVELSWSRGLGFNPSHIYAQQVGIRGGADSMVMRCNDGAGTVIFNGYWLLGRQGQVYEQGIHIDKYHKLVLKGHRWRGKTPTDVGLKVAEHMAYLKRSLNNGAVFLIDQDGRGGNRTGVMQIRPGADEDATLIPSGPIVVLDCFSDGYGWTHGTTPETSGGGGAITVWSAPNDPVFILRNRVTNARYAALMIGGQGYSVFPGMTTIDRNWYGASGYPIQRVVVEGNTFANPTGDRPTASISNVGQVDLFASNIWGANSKLVIDNGWSMTRAVPTRPTAKRCGQVNFLGGRPAGVLLMRGVMPGSDTETAYTTSEIDGLIRP